MKNQFRTFISICSYLLMALTWQEVSALDGSHVAVIVNSDYPDSNMIAQYYCSKRKVPMQQVIKVPMPIDERITRTVYEQEILPEIIKQFKAALWSDQIQCLVTTSGVPLIIGDKVLTSDEKILKEKLIAQINHSFTNLLQMHQALNDVIANLKKSNNKDNSDKIIPFKIKEDLANGQTCLVNSLSIFESALKTIKDLDLSNEKYGKDLIEFNKLFEAWGGKARVFEVGLQRYRVMAPSKAKQDIKKILLTQREQIETINKALREYENDFNDLLNPQSERSSLIIAGGGMNEYCFRLLKAVSCLRTQESLSAFDSELSVMLKTPYTLRKWVDNDFRTEISSWPLVSKSQQQLSGRSLMVARLDGPTVNLAKGLVDKAIAAEALLLKGSAYFDARGITKEIDELGSYGNFDQKVRETAQMVQKETMLDVILDDQKPLFAKGSCPDVLLYCGWYSVRNYIDAFAYLPGAVGYHLASYECETLRWGRTDSNVWCKRMIEHGITATMGPVAEPFLHSFPNPKGFFTELVSGDYTLVECYYHNKPYNSWRMVLIGDPLYKPKYIKPSPSE